MPSEERKCFWIPVRRQTAGNIDSSFTSSVFAYLLVFSQRRGYRLSRVHNYSARCWWLLLPCANHRGWGVSSKRKKKHFNSFRCNQKADTFMMPCSSHSILSYIILGEFSELSKLKFLTNRKLYSLNTRGQFRVHARLRYSPQRLNCQKYSRMLHSNIRS